MIDTAIKTSPAAQEQIPAPSFRLFGMEPIRAAFEYAGMRRIDTSRLPRGDGHPVVIFPGLASDTRATGPLRELLQGLGYTTYHWGRGVNNGPQGDVHEWLRALSEDVRAMVAMHRQPVTLIGWSLGGIYAREVAKHIGPAIRQMITIGSPFAGGPEQTRVGLLWRWVNGRPMPRDLELQRRLRTAPKVPTVSIYSRSDGVVAWQACVQPGKDHQVQHIEVQSSHCGMCWNPEVLQIVADRLHQPMSTWRRIRHGWSVATSGGVWK